MKKEEMNTQPNKMSVWGIGRKWLGWSFATSLPVFIIAWAYRSSLVVSSIDPWLFYGTGIFLLTLGVPFLLLSAITLGRNFKAGELCTTGVFAMCRNPIYAAWILFLVPGILLFFRIPFLLLSPLIMYITLRVFLSKEEKWLEETFGSDYRNYKKTTNRVVPNIAGLFRRRQAAK